jgi:protein-tyrosine-phosphatase
VTTNPGRYSDRSHPLNIVTLCTGNVARSVMLGYMLTTLAESSGEQWEIRTAGTHVAEGSAMSSRTRDALVKIEGLGEHRYGSHRSRQLTNDDARWADVILASEADHVNFVRRAFPDESRKAVQLAEFTQFAPREGSFDEQLRVTSALEPDPVFDVGDPAGGDQAVYDYCARELWELAKAFTLLVGSAT